MHESEVKKMIKVISTEQIENFEMYLDERRELMQMDITPADKVYYDGLIKSIELLGFDYVIKEDKHKLF